MRNKEIQKLYHSKNWPGTKQKNLLVPKPNMLLCKRSDSCNCWLPAEAKMKYKE